MATSHHREVTMFRHPQRLVPIMFLGSLVFAVPTVAATHLSPTVRAFRPLPSLQPRRVQQNGESVLYAFQGGNDGALPYAGLTADKTVSGSFYGATAHGGSAGAGTIFKITLAGSVYAESVLYTFQGGTDGAYPFGGLLVNRAGTLFGTTYTGSTAGTV